MSGVYTPSQTGEAATCTTIVTTRSFLFLFVFCMYIYTCIINSYCAWTGGLHYSSFHKVTFGGCVLCNITLQQAFSSSSWTKFSNIAAANPLDAIYIYIPVVELFALVCFYLACNLVDVICYLEHTYYDSCQLWSSSICRRFLYTHLVTHS